MIILNLNKENWYDPKTENLVNIALILCLLVQINVYKLVFETKILELNILNHRNLYGLILHLLIWKHFFVKSHRMK